MYKIKVIIPYFGKLPNQYKFWYQSAINNPSVDFLLITDNHEIVERDNIVVIYCNFTDFVTYVNQKLSYKTKITSPYKLCDLRPCYGVIFDEYLKGYDFWGFGDIDLIYGDIRSFISNSVLDKYSYISGWGHLTLVKNCKYYNDLYLLNVSGCLKFEDVMDDPSNKTFDEYGKGGFSDKVAILQPNDIWRTNDFDDLLTPRKYLGFISEFRPYFNSNNLYFMYEENKLFRIYYFEGKFLKEPSLYVHFKQRQKLIKVCTDNTNKYYLIPNKIIESYDIDEKHLSTEKKYSLLYQSIMSYRFRFENIIRNIFHL